MFTFSSEQEHFPPTEASNIEFNGVLARALFIPPTSPLAEHMNPLMAANLFVESARVTAHERQHNPAAVYASLGPIARDIGVAMMTDSSNLGLDSDFPTRFATEVVKFAERYNDASMEVPHV